ncbi:MAG: T9SS type A sorting domain-containing protein, partial [Flammeovirgaceae bacterium]
NVLNGQPYDASQFCSVPFKNLPKWRDGAELRALNGKMYLMGGWNPLNPKDCDGNNVFYKDRTNEIWSTTDGVEWVRELPYSSDRTKIWEERHVFANLVHSGELWIFGGDPNGGHYQNDVWKSSDGKNWNLLGILPENLKNRVLSLYNEFNGQMWIMGGQTFPEFIPNGPPLIFYNDVYSSTDGLNWSKKKDASWPARGVYSGSVVLNGKMWVLGGGIYQSTHLNDVWSTSDGDNWTQEVDFAPWEGRQYHNVAVYDDKMWIIGGANPTASASIRDNNYNLNDAWYSGDGKNWYQVLNSPWPHRHASSVEVFNGELYLIAGNNIPAYNVLYLGLKGQAPIDVYKLSKSNGSGARVATSTTETNVKSNIKQEELQYGLKVYPNPSDGYFNIEIPNNVEAFSIIIYTALGSEVFKSDLSIGSTFHVGGLTKEGLYLVRLVDSKGNTIGIGKLLISR